LHIEVPPVKFREIAGDRTGETSAQIRERVVAARQRQHARFADKPKITCNARMGTRELKQFCELDEATKELLQNAMADLNLSARLRPDFESRADNCGPGRVRKDFQRPRFRGDSISFARPAIVDAAGCRPVPAIDKAAEL
jgi:hypothetical protein